MSVSSGTGGAIPLMNRVQAPTGARLVLVTHNAGRLAELRQILMPFVPRLVPESVISAASLRVPEPVKDGLSFVDNALPRARTLARVTGLSMVAGDSDLCVNVLDGALGISPVRWSGRHGNGTASLQLSLDQLGDVVDPYRDARFTCAAALVQPAFGGQAGRVTTVERFIEGCLVHAPQGERGFDYDPTFVFVQEDELGSRNHTTAQMTPEEEHATSHRGQTFHALVPVLAEVLAD